MLLHDLFEAPLPRNWDKQKFYKGSYNHQLHYARQRLKPAGRGYSREAFIAFYKGRKTVIKIANSEFGIDQNTSEITCLSNPEVMATGIVIPMVDYHRDKIPKWVQQEYAEPITEQEFETYAGGSLRAVVLYAARASRNVIMRNQLDDPPSDIDKTNPIVVGLISLLDTLPRSDLFDIWNIHNWGLYNGKPVIVDLGMGHTDVFACQNIDPDKLKELKKGKT